MQLNAQAVRVRELVEEAATLLATGDSRWRRVFTEAQRHAADNPEPFSMDDSITRLALLSSHACLVAGDGAGALDELDTALAAIARQRSRVTDEQALARLADHEWVSQLNRSQMAMAFDNWEVVDDALARCEELSSSTLDPAGRRRQLMVSVAAADLARNRITKAREGYQRAVAVFRKEDPASMGIVLMGLAQAEMLSGSFDEAERNIDRAEPLLGNDADALANVRQARAFIAAQRGEVEAAAERKREYARAASGELHPTHQRNADMAAAHADHLDGALAEAKRGFDDAVAKARATGHPPTISAALARASMATQDLALATEDREVAEGLHHAALAQLTEARDLLDEEEEPLRIAGIDVAMSDIVAQWHQDVDGLNVGLLGSALQRVDEAVRVLRAASLAADSAPARRDFAKLHAAHGFEVACTLAFRLGDKETLSRLITDRAAGYDWRAGRV